MTETEPVSSPQKRGVGRPKGIPKTGGKPPGHHNLPHVIRADLLKKSKSIEWLSKITRGETVKVADPRTGKEIQRRPTMQERLKAIELVMRKCLPDLSAVAVDQHVTAEVSQSIAVDHRQVARAVINVLGEAELKDVVPMESELDVQQEPYSPGTLP